MSDDLTREMDSDGAIGMAEWVEEKKPSIFGDDFPELKEVDDSIKIEEVTLTLDEQRRMGALQYALQASTYNDFGEFEQQVDKIEKYLRTGNFN